LQPQTSGSYVYDWLYADDVMFVVARRQMKTGFSGSNSIAQSHVIEHQLRDNPIYGRITAAPHQPSHLDNCNSVLHQHHQQQPQHLHQTMPAATAGHSYEKLDHVIINPQSSAANLLTTAAEVTTPDVVNTMGYLVAGPPTSRDQLARPIIIWAPRSRDAANNMAELNVVTSDHHQHGRQCCCATSASGLPSTATSGGGGGYMECDAARTRNHHAIGGDESRERHHVTVGAESGRHDGWLPRDPSTNHRCSRMTGPYTAMSHNRHNEFSVSAL